MEADRPYCALLIIICAKFIFSDTEFCYYHALSKRCS